MIKLDDTLTSSKKKKNVVPEKNSWQTVQTEKHKNGWRVGVSLQWSPNFFR